MRPAQEGMIESGLDRLTPRERDVVDRIAGGDRVKNVAAELFLSERTVRNHLSSAFAKLGVGSQSELIEAVRGDAAVHESAVLADDFRESHRRLRESLENLPKSDPTDLKALIRSALPLDEAGRSEWEVRIRLWQRANDDGALQAVRADEQLRWRDLFTELIADLKSAGRISEDIDAEDAMATLANMIVGAGLNLMNDWSAVTRQKQLAAIDAYIDTLVAD